ncbi:MAG: DUF4876 domain-containing protein [Candidatus Krumholzibacteria bacterium]|nr:DUF4876 domain-containing protein [Candidatus Krumholzibacteria bacterium]
MKHSAVIPVLAAAAAVLAASCGGERPSVPDGANALSLFAVDTSNIRGTGWEAVAEATVRVSSPTFQFFEEYETGPDGWAILERLPAGVYRISAEKINQEESYVILGQKELSLVYEPAAVDTIFMNYQQSSPLAINEIYYAGCDYSKFYFYDQFIELYNSSSETRYLDGHFLVRTTQVAEVIDPEAEDYALGYYVFAFPGESGVTRDIPIEPGEFVVVACDAIDHSRFGARCVDLSGADWEFFNSLGSDYDNPAVPNLYPISNLTNDFSMNLAHTAVLLSDGTAWEFGMHYEASVDDFKEYVNIPLATIIDGVEYSSNPDSDRYLTIRVDAGFAGVGMARYSGRSVQRRFPGLDSNNSSFDFEIIEPPSPGYQ